MYVKIPQSCARLLWNALASNKSINFQRNIDMSKRHVKPPFGKVRSDKITVESSNQDEKDPAISVTFQRIFMCRKRSLQIYEGVFTTSCWSYQQDMIPQNLGINSELQYQLNKKIKTGDQGDHSVISYHRALLAMCLMDNGSA